MAELNTELKIEKIYHETGNGEDAGKIRITAPFEVEVQMIIQDKNYEKSKVTDRLADVFFKVLDNYLENQFGGDVESFIMNNKD